MLGEDAMRVREDEVYFIVKSKHHWHTWVSLNMLGEDMARLREDKQYFIVK